MLPKKYPGKIYVFYTTRETSASWEVDVVILLISQKNVVEQIKQKQDISIFSPTKITNPKSLIVIPFINFILKRTEGALLLTS